MKKIIFILVGIVIGIAIWSAFIGIRVLPLFYTVFKYTGELPHITVVGDLNIIQTGNNDYMIKSISHPGATVLISTPSEQDLFIGVTEKSGNQFQFADRDSDGNWDHGEYSTSNSLYLYGREIGYPDVVTHDDTPSLIRIDGEYFEDRHVDGKHFIEKDGELIELEFVEWNHFKIKESEPVK